MSDTYSEPAVEPVAMVPRVHDTPPASRAAAGLCVVAAGACCGPTAS
jgi:hypothetical protein